MWNNSFQFKKYLNDEQYREIKKANEQKITENLKDEFYSSHSG